MRELAMLLCGMAATMHTLYIPSGSPSSAEGLMLRNNGEQNMCPPRQVLTITFQSMSRLDSAAGYSLKDALRHIDGVLCLAAVPIVVLH
jgi:hypothetical protein